MFSCLLITCLCGPVCADDKLWSANNEVDRLDVVEGGVSQAGDLASVSLPLQLLNVLQSAGREFKKPT